MTLQMPPRINESVAQHPLALQGWAEPSGPWGKVVGTAEVAVAA